MEPPYASLITSKLAERNVREVSSFRELVEGHTKWQHVARTLSNRVANLERWVSISTDDASKKSCHVYAQFRLCVNILWR